MNDLYICYTYYHLLITIIKSLTNNLQYDLLISIDIPQIDKMIDKIKQIKTIGNIYIINEAPYIELYESKNAIIAKITKRRILSNVFNEMTNINILGYDNIYTYNDMNLASSYLIVNEKKYHLIEDALDFFNYFDEYYNLKKWQYTQSNIFHKLKAWLKIGTNPWGQNKYCLDIEVNDISKIKISNKKVKELRRRKLFDSLTKQDKVIIYNLFTGNNVTERVIKGEKKQMILFTQPLFKDGFVKSEMEQLIVYKNIINEYYEKNFQVTIKPHPRDNIEYSNLIEEYECNYIDKNIPSEVLNFNQNVCCDDIVSITSTSINFVQNVKNRRLLGKEYIKECIKKNEN